MARRGRLPREYRQVHNAADRFEPQMKQRFLRAVKRIKRDYSINDAALAIARGDIDAVMELVSSSGTHFKPLGKVYREAFEAGGKIGAKQINEL